MKTIVPHLLFVYCLTAALYGEEQVAFHELSTVASENQIEICGFLYQTDDGTVVLASQPNLKSCCVGASHKIGEQLVVKDLDLLPQTQQVVTLRGTFYLDPETGQQILANSVVVPKKNRLHLWIAGGATGLLATFFLLRKRY